MATTSAFPSRDLASLSRPAGLLETSPRAGEPTAVGTAPLVAERAASESSSALDGYISLTQATKIAPGRPSINCVWRWCRRGVMSRSGERIRLTHIRVGGKLFTSSAWLDEFGRRLAEADARHFDRDLECDREQEAVTRPARRRSNHHHRQSQERHEAVARALDREGL